MSAFLQARDLRLKSFTADASFDLTIETGQRWLVSGASGSGKSTLMRSLLGLVSPRSGTVLVDGLDLHEVSHRQLLTLRQSMGVVFSGGGLLPAWSGLQNLMLPLRAIQGLEEEAAQAAVLAFAGRCKIPALWLERAVAELPAEQIMLLALARALLIEPKLLWVDSELLWGVLSQAGTRLGAQLSEQLARGCTLVVCAGVHGVPATQTPPCDAPSHWACMQGGWLECRQDKTPWTLDAANA
jgi:ABC-type lipoprotein export system ATPase subunit